MKMVCKVSDLQNIITLVSSPGTGSDGKSSVLIPNFLMDVQDKIYVKALGGNKSLFVNLEYKPDGEIIEKGSIPVGSVEVLQNYLSRFSSDSKVEVTKTSGKLTIKSLEGDEKTATLPIVHESHIESIEGTSIILEKYKMIDGVMQNTDKGIKLETKVVIQEAEKVKEVIDDADIVPPPKFFTLTIDENVMGQVGSEETGIIKTKIPATILQGKCKVSYSKGLDNIFTALKGSVMIFTNNNAPLWVVKEEPNYKVEYFLAPMKE